MLQDSNYSKTMGCCFCRPDTEVLYDPSVTSHATVGDIAFDKACTYSDPTIKGCEGLMYIKENVLYYEMACSGRLCCLSRRQAFNVTDITSVEVCEDRVETFKRQFIILRPRLKITVKPQSGSVTMIIVAMPDAAEFAAKLNELVSPNEKE